MGNALFCRVLNFGQGLTAAEFENTNDGSTFCLNASSLETRIKNIEGYGGDTSQERAALAALAETHAAATTEGRG